ncbi:MAG: TIGR02680 family protein, partial [Oligoflexus sp.]
MPSEAESLKTNTVNCDELIARFRPTRIGLINIYKCDDEVFNFNRGRLLLRGNNGAGKSRILALTLPFLFDGDVSPHRLEPDGDKARRIEWNLLMDQYPERLGYVWIEFGRISEDGKPIFVTLGCGLHAVKGRPQVTKWFFVSSQRVGYDLQLVRDRHPLSRDRLEEALSDHGRLFKTAAEYQREVDQQLFKLGRDNYKALVDLLIQLRQPQLTRQFDGERISAALSGALSPLSPNLIDQIADSFRSMEKDRQELSELNSALRAADLFMAKYSHYAKIASRRAAIDLRKKQVDVIEAVRQKKKLEVEQSEL